MKILRFLYLVICCVLVAVMAMNWQQSAPIQTQLGDLLPQNTQNAMIQAANRAEDQAFQQQIVLLVGASESEKAFQAAEKVVQLWRQSGLFEQVDGKIEPDFKQLRESLASLGLATLPHHAVQQLHHQPQQYFAERAEAAANPFSGSLLSLEEDWLGLSRFALEKPQLAALSWHSEHAMLYTESTDKTWVWLRAKLKNTQPNPALLDLWQNSKLAAPDATVLATGGALFAADAKSAAERESSLMSLLGGGFTILFLLMIFRSWRIFLVLLPLATGLLVGFACTWWVFGKVHAMTLVVGSSLIGVLVDFPLHWLAPALLPQDKWDAHGTMRRVLPSFLMSLGITALGYLLLWWTPLPILQQTAVFSASALLGAFLATVLWLPPLFQKYAEKNRQVTDFFKKYIDWWSRNTHKMGWGVWGGALTLALVLGIAHTRWQDDIRDWAKMRPDLLADAQQINQISGLQNQHTLLLHAESPDALLQQSHDLTQKFQNIAQIQSLSQWILPESEQVQLKQQLRNIATQPEHFAPLVDLGVPAEQIQAALKQAAEAPNVSLMASLSAPQAEGFKSLYLGEIEGRSVGLLKLSDVRSENWRDRLPENAMVLDKREQLNQQFAETRNQAAVLKMISLVVALLILCGVWGWRRGGLIWLLPMVGLLATVGLLGWLNVAVGLFAMFGLLLAAAIGVDYAVYALTAPESAAAKMAGITLAATTTGVSFALLAWSATPAVAHFGLSVALGVLLNYVLVMSVLRFKLT